MLIKQTLVGHMDVFCYLLICEKSREAVVIDPGGETDKIIGQIIARQLAIKYIINSHNHPDHTCGNRALREATGGLIVMHEGDQALMDSTETVAFFRRLNFPLSNTPPADKLVRDHEILRFGELSLQVIHTPGHSPGSMCLLSENHLFTGDSLFVGAAGRLDLPGADFNTLMNSLEEKIVPLPGDTIIWPGHDYGDTKTSTIGREKKENPFLGGDW